MSQNRSTAVMQRRKEPHDSLDYFPTPPWATRALCERLQLKSSVVLEPACGGGYMAKPLAEYARKVIARDVHDYGFGEVRDFLWHEPEVEQIDWVITNPPFVLAEQFVLKGLTVANAGVAVLVRSAFLEGIGRFERLWAEHPPTQILQFIERVPMVKGRVDPDASSATAYSWIVWNKHDGNMGTRFGWIPPCRDRLERETDYTRDAGDAPLLEAIARASGEAA